MANDYVRFEDLRERTKKKLQKASGLRIGNDLEAAILSAYYNPLNRNKVKEVIDAPRSFSIELVITSVKIDRGLLDDLEHDD